MKDIVYTILTVYVGVAGFCAFAFGIGMAIWRLYSGKRTRFGEIFSHWDVKDAFCIALLFPYFAFLYLQNVIALKKSQPQAKALVENQQMPSKTTHCPVCGAIMRRRTGKFGVFWGCSRYPSCKGTRNA